MLMPALSVTAIGLIVGLVMWVVRGRFTGPVVSSILGAWAGFLVGAPFGILLDVVGRTGDRFVVVSHLAAVLGAVSIAIREHRLAVHTDHLDEVAAHREVAG